MADKLNPKAFAIALTILVLIGDLIGFFGFGMVGMRSMMGGYMGFGLGWGFAFFGLIGSLIVAFAAGYLFAWLYNWADKEFKQKLK